MYINTEKENYYDIVDDILNNEEFQKLKDITHHGATSRYNHSVHVSYHVYKITKFLNLNYEEATRASLMHDFFFEHNPKSKQEQIKFLVEHPKQAVNNAKKYYELTDLQENLILAHMFPFRHNLPKYMESWINNFVDNYISIYEKSRIMKEQLVTAGTFLLILGPNINKFIK